MKILLLFAVIVATSISGGNCGANSGRLYPLKETEMLTCGKEFQQCPSTNPIVKAVTIAKFIFDLLINLIKMLLQTVTSPLADIFTSLRVQTTIMEYLYKMVASFLKPSASVELLIDHPTIPYDLCQRTIGCPSGMTSAYECTNPDESRFSRGYERLAGHYCSLKYNCSLPNARELSLMIAEEYTFPEHAKNVNLISFFYAQLGVHDGMKFQERPNNDNGGCSMDQSRVQQKSCTTSAPIRVNESDPFYSQYDYECLSFVTGQTVNDQCVLKEDNFLSYVTPSLDRSEVYGNSAEDIESVKGDDGWFRLEKDGFPVILDDRANQTSFLLASHFIVINLHQAFAKGFKNICPHLSEDQRFALARTCLIRVGYLVVYKSMASIMGREWILAYNLSNPNDCFDPTINPQAISEYACAAGRFLHVFSPATMKLSDENYETLETFPLRDTFQNVQLAKDKLMDITRGLIISTVETESITRDILNGLEDKEVGDLLATDIQRSRDCCVKPYIHYLDLFWGAKITSFDQLTEFMPENATLALQRHYKSVDEIDLYVGGTFEYPAFSGLCGKTFAHIIGIQFQRNKCGDPLFWGHTMAPEEKMELITIDTIQLFMVSQNLTQTPPDLLRGMQPGEAFVERKYESVDEFVDLEKLASFKCIQA